jgi:ATP-dependent Lon protease
VTTKIDTHPLLPLRDIVVLPHMVVTLFVGREKSISALKKAISTDGKIALVFQKDASVDAPSSLDDLYSVGTLGEVIQLISLPEGSIKVLVEGRHRIKIHSVQDEKEGLMARISPLVIEPTSEETTEVLNRILLAEFEDYGKYNKKITTEILENIQTLSNDEEICDSISTYLALNMDERQQLLEATTFKDRAELLLFYMRRETEALKTEETIREKLKSQLTKNHRDYYLQEQLKAIQKELYNEDGKDDLTQLADRIKKAILSKEASEKAESEIKKLRHMNPMAAEASVIKNYLDCLVELPWKKQKWKTIDLKKAQEILDRDHYGLERVKERIVEFLAVQQRLKNSKGQVLCLVGPPGVGKTSMAKSIATVTQRPFVRMALGGVRDEAEIRGHRRTYIGAMPGKILQNMKKAKATNPLFLLDELDKMGADWRGDPASAMLEVLDSEQNSEFNDHYLEVGYDLSQVMFLATANTLDLPRPLLDRLEIIRIEGYTEEEKVQISLRHLVEKQKREHGLSPKEVAITEDAIRDIIRYYTREAGVRNVERQIGKLMRKSVREISQSSHKTILIDRKDLEKYLGVPKYQFSQADEAPQIGVTTGLAWTELGGDLLSIETVKTPGKGKTVITGKLGDVMQESVQTAFSYIKSRAKEFGIDPDFFLKSDIHLHVPEGATPKDGPSAGIAICTSIVSLLTGRPVDPTIAMTGEITLRGKVLAIGGLKEKLLAAQRGGIKTVLIPQENEKDLIEISDLVKKDLSVIPVKMIDEVLEKALMPVFKENENLLLSSVPLSREHQDISIQ